MGPMRHTHGGSRLPDVAARVEHARARLTARGQRVTSPRLAVIEALATMTGHPDAEAVHEVVAATTGMHRATTYRVLHHLVELGIVTHVHPEHSTVRFHLADGEGADEHVHISCLSCGRVLDAPPGVLDEAATRLAEVGFTLHPGHVALSGTCRQCRTGPEAGL